MFYSYLTMSRVKKERGPMTVTNLKAIIKKSSRKRAYWKITTEAGDR